MKTTRLLFVVLALPLVAVTLSSQVSAGEEFNWTEAAQFVDSFPFKQRFIDSLADVRHVVFPPSPLRTIPPQSFARGEMLVYNIGWSFVKAGYVILTATPDTSFHCRTLRLGGKALSRGFVSTFYRMRDYIISTVDAEGLYPLFFEEHLREGKHYKSNYWLLFDHAKDTLHVKGSPVRTVGVPKFTNDYISILYMARTKHFAPGDTFSLPFFVDGKLYNLFFSCKGRESIDYDGKDVKCLVVQPQPSDDKGEFNKRKGLQIWFSDDEYKLPIKIKAKIAIGSITANLIHVWRQEKAAPAPAAAAVVPETKKVSDSGKSNDSLALSDTTLPKHSGATSTDSLRPHDTARLHDTAKSPGASKSNDSAKSGSPDTAHKPNSSKPTNQ